MIARESPEGAGAFCHEAVGADEDDDGDHGGEGGRATAGTSGVMEDLDQGHAGGGSGGGVKVADAEEGGDEEDEACDGAEVDGHDDCEGCVAGGVAHFFDHF